MSMMTRMEINGVTVPQTIPKDPKHCALFGIPCEISSAPNRDAKTTPPEILLQTFIQFPGDF